MKKCVLGLMICLCLLGLPMQAAQAQQPVVYAVLFYSQSCSHCHYVITNVLPPIQEEYGEQLQILYIDVSQPEGSSFFHAAFDTVDIPEDRQGYVPTMVIGTHAMIGARDIPEQMPDLIRKGLAEGGIDLPPIPGLREAYEAAAVAEQGDDPEEDTQASAPISTTYQKTTWRDRLKQDSLGNSFALGVLAILIVGLSIQINHGARLFDVHKKRRWNIGYAGRLFILSVATITTLIAGTLVFEGGGISLPTVLAIGVTAGMSLVTLTIASQSRQSSHAGYTFPGWLMPLIILVGLVVAGYLAYVEVGENEAVCGAVGDCNTVQQSDYATLFGLIPIGLLGVIGYILILASWIANRVTTGGAADISQALLFGFALCGTLFSIYLTFLEPFVIGATCAWCLTSAMLMILILSLEAPAGWAAVNRLADRLVRSPARRSQPHW
jgi:uncharacterized membrane protein